MKKTLFITAALLTAMTTTTFAYADSHNKQRNHVSFEQMDSNQDGKVSKDEATGRLAENFDKLDTDNDGFVTKADLPNQGKHHNGKKFAEMDTNNDGKISREEATGRLAENFDKFDTNGDGFITKDELPRRGKHHKGMMFKNIDTDNDGRISKQEMMQHFDKLDTNGDGYITKEDMRAHHHKR
ncbi:MAG: EF-hand domain-containing protein [Moritella sp.]|uniref:EF-hand domain-containing protein n=1 Tax=Moritella sp. TaxID=78556 RepID=UPI0029B3891D|nr:EF-hand domain-containing protein [Moritella sp.]MDX2319526.1 EF-hand domain-containing protein [Moritella sp.]